MTPLPWCSRCTKKLRAGEWQEWTCIGCAPQLEELDRELLAKAWGNYWRVRCERCCAIATAEERGREEAIAEWVITAHRTRDAITGFIGELIAVRDQIDFAVRDQLDCIIAVHEGDEAHASIGAPGLPRC